MRKICTIVGISVCFLFFLSGVVYAQDNSQNHGKQNVNKDNPGRHNENKDNPGKHNEIKENPQAKALISEIKEKKSEIKEVDKKIREIREAEKAHKIQNNSKEQERKPVRLAINKGLPHGRSFRPLSRYKLLRWPGRHLQLPAIYTFWQ